MNTIPATQLQSYLSMRWDQACKWLDRGEPLSERFYENMEQLEFAMNRYQAVENSLDRAGLASCIGSPEKCTQSMVACKVCAGPSKGKAPIKSSHLGRSKDGRLWQIDVLAF